MDRSYKRKVCMSLTYSKIEEMTDIQVGQLQVKQTEST